MTFLIITTIAAALGLALIMGFIAARLKLPALVGYLIAGIIIGPATPGFVTDIELSNQLAEIGVMLLMFGVGLHFSLDDLLAVRRIALPGAIVQIAVATLLGMGTTALWDWSLAAGIVFGHRSHRDREPICGEQGCLYANRYIDSSTHYMRIVRLRFSRINARGEIYKGNQASHGDRQWREEEQ